MTISIRRFSGFIAAALLISFTMPSIRADWLDKPSVVVYWGQNSGGSQKSLATYCDGDVDVVIIAFTITFTGLTLPGLNLANSCDGPVFPGSVNLLSCPEVGKDIITCQSMGKTILMSLGGDTGGYGYATPADAVKGANTLWDLYGKGTSKTRPFGDAVIDGFDLDIETGTAENYEVFIKTMRANFAKDTSKKYYMVAAPQCFLPDEHLKISMKVANIDAVNVQFYNNEECGVGATGGNGNSFNFDQWDNWATKQSVNKNTKVLLGLPGNKAAATTGYVDPETLASTVKELQSKYASFNGVMLWDVSAAISNKVSGGTYLSTTAALIHGLSGGKSSSSGNSTDTTTTKATKPKYTKTSSSVSKKTTTAKANTKHTATTTDSESISSSTTSNAPSAVKTGKNSSSGCPAAGGTCPTPGYYACVGDSTTVCGLDNKWSPLISCGSGSECVQTTDSATNCVPSGTTTTTSKNSCGSSSSKRSFDASIFSEYGFDKVEKNIKVFQSSRTKTQFTIHKFDSTSFSASIKARRLHFTPFSKTINIQFKVDSGVEVTSVKSGHVTQNGQLVTIQYNNPLDESMEASIQIEGRIQPGTDVIPTAKYLKIA